MAERAVTHFNDAPLPGSRQERNRRRKTSSLVDRAEIALLAFSSPIGGKHHSQTFL